MVDVGRGRRPHDSVEVAARVGPACQRLSMSCHVRRAMSPLVSGEGPSTMERCIEMPPVAWGSVCHVSSAPTGQVLRRVLVRRVANWVWS